MSTIPHHPGHRTPTRDVLRRLSAKRRRREGVRIVRKEVPKALLEYQEQRVIVYPQPEVPVVYTTP